MGEDLKRCNVRFNELKQKYKERKQMSKDEEMIAYYFFLAGFNEGAGMTQVVA